MIAHFYLLRLFDRRVQKAKKLKQSNIQVGSSWSFMEPCNGGWVATFSSYGHYTGSTLINRGSLVLFRQNT